MLQMTLDTLEDPLLLSNSRHSACVLIVGAHAIIASNYGVRYHQVRATIPDLQNLNLRLQRFASHKFMQCSLYGDPNVIMPTLRQRSLHQIVDMLSLRLQ